MDQNALRNAILDSASRFADEIMQLYSEAFESVAAGLRRASPAATPTRQSAPPPPPPPAPPRRTTRTGRVRPTAAELEERVYKLIANNRSGMRAREINRYLGTTSRELERPLGSLVNKGRIRKTGQSSATTYFPI